MYGLLKEWLFLRIKTLLSRLLRQLSREVLASGWRHWLGIFTILPDFSSPNPSES